MSSGLFGEYLINKPAPIGYGITNMPVHLPTYWAMGDRYYSTNLGMATQHNLYNSGYDQRIYHLAKNADWYAKNDPMLTSLIGNPTSGIGYIPSYTPFNTFNQYSGYSPFMLPGVNGINNRVPQMTPGSTYASTIKSMYLPKLKEIVTDLEMAMCEDGLSEKHQLVLQKQIDKANELIAKLEKATASKNVSMEDATTLQSEISSFTSKAGQVISRINADIAKQQENKLVEEAEKEEKTNEELIKKQEEKVTALKTKAADICRNIYLGCEGVGTDYDKLNVINDEKNGLNKDNVVTVLRNWENQNYNSLTGDKGGDETSENSCAGLIETLFDEESCYNDNDECDDVEPGTKIANAKSSCGYVWNITCALEARAKELKLYPSLQAQFTAIYDELDDTCVDQTLVQKSIKTIFDALNEADASDIALKLEEEIKTEADNKKTEAANAKKPQIEAQKKKALAVALKNHLGLKNEISINNKVQIIFDKKGNFKHYQVELEGCTITDSNASSLIKWIEDAGIDAKQLYSSSSVA